MIRYDMVRYDTGASSSVLRVGLKVLKRDDVSLVSWDGREGGSFFSLFFFLGIRDMVGVLRGWGRVKGFGWEFVGGGGFVMIYGMRERGVMWCHGGYLFGSGDGEDKME